MWFSCISHFGKSFKNRFKKRFKKSPSGAQIDENGAQEPCQKNITKWVPKMSPNWSPRGSQNGAKTIKNEVLEASCFKAGSQVASRPPPGSILERFGDHFGNSFTILCMYFVGFLGALASNMLQIETFKITRARQQNSVDA